MNAYIKMITSVIAGFFLISACTQDPQKPDNHNIENKARYLAKHTIIIDTHIDVPYRLQDKYEDISKATESGDFDYPRARSGGLNAPFMSIYIAAEYETSGGGKALADKLIDDVETIVKNAPDKFAFAYTTADIEKNFKADLISLPMGMENGTPLEGNLDNLTHFYKRGIRYITLAHSLSNHISDSSYDENRQWHGLSDFGKNLVAAMNKMGIMIDISHVSDEAFYQVIALSKTPVIASHSSVRYFTPGFERNMDDTMIKTLAKKGGVIQINFGSSFVSQASRDWYDNFKEARNAFMQAHNAKQDSDETKAFAKSYREQYPFHYASIEDVLDHFDHVVKLVGIDYVGIGSDYDGVGDSLPTGLKDVSSYPNLIAGLLKRGHTELAIKKILSGNLMRVWREVEQYAQHQSDPG